ncbi:MAG: hypothetical protein P8J33_01285 [Pirellulaceae bacterium]|nr:hypothetical protein [Pirellulaceae bacterium]
MSKLIPSDVGNNLGVKPNFQPREEERRTINLVNTIRFQTRRDKTYKFQNFFWRETMKYDGLTYSYLPFTFSGIAINRAGDNVDATLAFPNNNLSRGWALKAIEEGWGCEVRVAQTKDPEQSAEGFTTLYKYFGLCSAGGWDDKVITIRLNSVLDSVGAEIPTIALDNARVGPLPTTTNVRL